jgi:signal transduction histidine kinase
MPKLLLFILLFFLPIIQISARQIDVAEIEKRHSAFLEAYHKGDTLAHSLITDTKEAYLPSERNTKLYAKTLELTGLSYQTKGKFVKAISNYLDALKILKELKLIPELIQVYNHISGVHYDAGLYSEGIVFLKQAVKLAEQRNLHLKQQILLNNIAGAYVKLDSLDKAEEYAERALNLSNKQTTDYHKLHILITKSEVAAAKNNSDKLFNILKEVKQVLKGAKLNAKDKNSFNFIIYLGEAKYYSAKKYQQKAIEKLLDAKDLLRPNLNKEKEVEYYRSSAFVYRNLNIPDSSSKYQLKQFALSDSLLNLNKQKLLYKELMSFTEYEKTLQEKILVQEKKYTITAVVGSFLLLILFLISYFAFRKAKKLYKRTLLLNKEVDEQQQKLVDQNSELEMLHQQKDRLFSVVVHDFKTPLNTLEGMLYLLKNKMISPEEMQEFSGQLLQQLSVSRDHINNYLTWVRTKTSGIKVEPTNFSVASLINTSIQYHLALANEKQICITKAISSVTTIKSDRNMLEIILNNLLSNAIKYSYNDSEVQIETSFTDKEYCIAVTDKGKGMRQELVSATITQQHKPAVNTGSGIGLKLSRELIIQLNGRIDIKSEINMGTTVTICLPDTVVVG